MIIDRYPLCIYSTGKGPYYHLWVEWDGNYASYRTVYPFHKEAETVKHETNSGIKYWLNCRVAYMMCPVQDIIRFSKLRGLRKEVLDEIIRDFKERGIDL